MSSICYLTSAPFIFFLSRIPRDNLPSIPTPVFALWGRKQSGSDILYSPSRLRRNQDVLLGAGMIVSALAGRFVSLQVISWMDNDRYTFPAIFQFCRRGSEKHRTLWPWGHLCKASKQTLKISKSSHWGRQRHIQPVSNKTWQWPGDHVDVEFSEWWLQSGGGWGNIEEATLDFWRVWWTLMGRRSRRMRGRWCGRRGDREEDGVWPRSFFWFIIFEPFLTVKTTQYMHSTGGETGAEGWSAEVERWSRSFDLTGVINAKGYYPLEKVLAPWLKSCYATCLTGRSDLASFCFATTT